MSCPVKLEVVGTATITSPEWTPNKVNVNPFIWFFSWPWVIPFYAHIDWCSAEYSREVLYISPGFSFCSLSAAHPFTVLCQEMWSQLILSYLTNSQNLLDPPGFLLPCARIWKFSQGCKLAHYKAHIFLLFCFMSHEDYHCWVSDATVLKTITCLFFPVVSLFLMER